jgi:hypothetical protein
MPREFLGELDKRQRASFLEKIKNTEGLGIGPFSKKTVTIQNTTPQRAETGSEGRVIYPASTLATVGATQVWYEFYDPAKPSEKHRQIRDIYDRVMGA